MTQSAEHEKRSLASRAEAVLSRLRSRGGRAGSGRAERTTLVRDAMSRRVATIDADAPVALAAEHLAERDVGVLAVCEPDDRLSGVITDRDIVVRVVAQGLDPAELTVGDCRSDEPVTASPQETLEEAAQRMDEQQVRRLPVTESGHLVGIVGQSDLASHGADVRAGRLLGKLARQRGDRRSARWLQDHPYREERVGATSAPRLRGRY